MKNSIKTCLAESKRITGLAKLTICIAVILSLAFTANVSALPTLVATLTGDTLAGGSALEGGGTLVTSAGDITFSGEFKNGSSDDEFTNAGASYETFNILLPGDRTAELFFDFDVVSLEFIYGGNVGDIEIEARDKVGGIVDSYFDPDTLLTPIQGGSAGPVTLSGSGIRSLWWTDAKGSIGYAALDNIKVMVDTVVIPSPSALVLAGIGVGLVSRLRKRKII
jgi:hypothetical protein